MQPKNKRRYSTRKAPLSLRQYARLACRGNFSKIAVQMAAVVAISTTTSAVAYAQAEAVSRGKRVVWPLRKSTGTTGQVYAYSEANGLVNQTLDEAHSFGGGPLPITPLGRIYHAGPPPHTAVNPVQTTGRHNLDEFDFISMSSRSVNGADAYGTGMVTRLADRLLSSPKTIDASAEVTGRSGLALGAAEDPMYFTPGPLTVLDTINELDLIAVGDGSHAGYQMTMSSNIPGFEQLYDMSILLHAGEQPEIFFESNPLLGLDDALITGAFHDSLVSITGGYQMATPVELEFSLDSSSSFEIDFLSNAWGVTVPTPGALALLACALVTAAPTRRRRC